MSRGLGRVQRAVLASLRDQQDELSTSALADLVYSSSATPSQKAATRRALVALVRLGLVAERKRSRWWWRRWYAR